MPISDFEISDEKTGESKDCHCNTKLARSNMWMNLQRQPLGPKLHGRYIFQVVKSKEDRDEPEQAVKGK
jgi:hypothetical protein